MDEDDESAYSFMDTEIIVNGEGFIPNSQNIRVRIGNSFHMKEFTPTNITIDNQNQLKVTIPTIAELGFTYPLTFPILLMFGISFNDGTDFAERPIVIKDRCLYNIPMIHTNCHSF